MEIKVLRDIYTQNSTEGQLFIDDVFQCYTLELPTPATYPGKKGINCVPFGKYNVIPSTYQGEVMEWMNKDVPDLNLPINGLPWIQNIDGMTYPEWTDADDGISRVGIHADRHVYIHIGNHPSDTLGCLLVAQQRGANEIEQSTAAYEKLYPLIVDAMKAGNLTIEYIDGRAA